MDNTLRKEASIDAIKIAITALNQQGKKATQQSVAELTKGSVSISTIRRHWKDVKITPPQKISSTSNDFERFKRRATQSTMGISKLNPQDF